LEEESSGLIFKGFRTEKAMELKRQWSYKGYGTGNEKLWNMELKNLLICKGFGTG
jgi:hypothetical protein